MGRDGEIVLTAEDGSEEAFFVVEKAQIAGREYLLVANRAFEEDGDTEGGADEEAMALILRANKEHSEQDTVLYDVVDDEDELIVLSKYFEELVEDLDLSL